MEKIFIVDGLGFYSMPTSAHATIESAKKAAADLVNLLLVEGAQPQDATPETWEADLLHAQKAYAMERGFDVDDLGKNDEVGDAAVWIIELPIQRD